MKNNCFLSIVVPVYNESKRVKGLPKIVKFLNSKKFSWEIIVVNDGSTDDTLAKLKNYQGKYKFQIINYRNNRGKGHAIKRGMLKARGKYILFTDIDLSTPLKEFNSFIPHLTKHDVIIGTRKTHNSKLMIRQNMLREALGKGFTFLSRKILGVNVSDFTCGFKCFSNNAASKIFPKLTIDRWGFDSEIMFLIGANNLSLKEVSVIWKNDPDTRVKFPQDIIRSLNDLIRIRLNNYRGLYSN